MYDRLKNDRGAILKGATCLLRAQRRCFRGCHPSRVTGKKASLLVVETSRFDMGVFAKSGKKFRAIGGILKNQRCGFRCGDNLLANGSNLGQSAAGTAIL